MMVFEGAPVNDQRASLRGLVIGGLALPQAPARRSLR
jgi:hypothetical protein